MVVFFKGRQQNWAIIVSMKVELTGSADSVVSVKIEKGAK